MHREQLIEDLGADYVETGRGQLRAHQQRLDAADNEHDEGGDAVEDANALVIDGGDPGPNAGRVSRAGDGEGESGHGRPPSLGA